jgi:cellobiose phosphorylase
MKKRNTEKNSHFGGKYARIGKGRLWQFSGKNDGSFIVPDADYISRLYFPLMNEAGMKCSITPELKGDICSSFQNYLTVATVTEELHRNVSGRNLWIRVKGEDPWSVSGNSVFQKSRKWTKNAELSRVEGDFGVFKVERINESLGLKSSVTVFVPAGSDLVEIMMVDIENIGESAVQFDVVSSMPIFGRHADNIRDHRQVTTMFQNTYMLPDGVRVKPTIVHDERGHTVNQTSYCVIGSDEAGNPPDQIWGALRDFIGEGGSLDNPEAVYMNLAAPVVDNGVIGGREAVAALGFTPVNLDPGNKKTYIFLHGITSDPEDIEVWRHKYSRRAKIDDALAKTRFFWQNYVNQVAFQTGNSVFDNWMKWVGFQLKCRQIFGNSYLPDFGYGRGGRGWRDLWQDLLSLFLMDPESARSEIINNFRGVRVDGSNATIIGTSPGEFIADRNNVPRSWCDHGAWPVFVLNFYIQQTGDFDILFEELPYWKDQFSHRNKQQDDNWQETEGNVQLTSAGDKYNGSIFEHLLLQQLSAFFHVGEHNNLLLEGADWNDTLDMAREKGESVCFHNFYGENLRVISGWLEYLSIKGIKSIALLSEIKILLDRLSGQDMIDYASPVAKQERILAYFDLVRNRVSGKKEEIPVKSLIDDLNNKVDHVVNHIRKNEWVETEKGDRFFNGHYDNDGIRVHGDHPLGTRIDLTSQVMPIMFDIATEEQIQAIYASVKKYLKDPDKPGLRLCTDFKELKLNLGRITGFVYGHKEHGSKWMQQNIMLMYGLYKRNFVKEGYEVFRDVFSLCTRSEVAKIFPGVPSYFENGDHGSYAYLTGSSTWLMLTMTTQIFGVRGEAGNLCIEPKLALEQFDEKCLAEIRCQFRNIRIRVIFSNDVLKDWPDYQIKAASLNNQEIHYDLFKNGRKAIIDYDTIDQLNNKEVNTLKIRLS